MLKLMKLEMKKVKMGGYIKRVVIINLVILAMMVITDIMSDGVESSTDILASINFIECSVFIIFASVLIARFIIEEYKSNTITLLFMYPINRKKLIIAKLLIVVLFTFISIVLSNIFIDFVLYITNSFYKFIPDKLTIALIINNFKTIGINALVSTGIGLVPLYFGMRKKSGPATIISSIAIITILNGSINGGLTLKFISVIPITLSIIGVFIAYLAIRNIEHVDVIK